MSEPLTVTFTLKAGDVWIDPEGVSWYIDGTYGGEVQVRRVLVEERDPLDLVRTWRKMGDPT
jgi:hypothetical protein